MDRSTTWLAVSAAQRVLADNGLGIQHAEVLQNSNRLTVRFGPAGVVARIAMAATRPVAEREVEIVRELEQLAAPVAPLDHRFSPTVHDAGEFIVTLWEVCDPRPPAAVGPDEYADALARLHAGLRQVDGANTWPVVFTDRIEEALCLVEDPVGVPGVLDEADRQLVASILRGGTAAARSGQQLLHGEPHSGNVMRTEGGLVFRLRDVLSRPGRVRPRPWDRCRRCPAPRSGEALPPSRSRTPGDPGPLYRSARRTAASAMERQPERVTSRSSCCNRGGLPLVLALASIVILYDNTSQGRLGQDVPRP